MLTIMLATEGVGQNTDEVMTRMSISSARMPAGHKVQGVQDESPALLKAEGNAEHYAS